MKSAISWIVVVLSALGLVACNALSGNAASAASGIGTSQNANGSNGQMSQVMQLAIGTLLLDKSNYPIDAAQAATLLPLWKAARSLSTSETAAMEEKEGLVKQIQGSMTAEQLKAIKDMDLNMQNLPSLSQELGVDLGVPGPAGARPATALGAGSANSAPPADFGDGIPMDGGPGGPPPESSNTASNGTSGSGSLTRSSQASFLGLSSGLLDQVISSLESKAQ